METIKTKNVTKTCPSCNGAGKVLNVTAASLYFDSYRGPILSKECERCKGTGVISEGIKDE